MASRFSFHRNLRIGHWCFGGVDAKAKAFDWNRCYLYQVQQDRLGQNWSSSHFLVLPIQFGLSFRQRSQVFQKPLMIGWVSLDVVKSWKKFQWRQQKSDLDCYWRNIGTIFRPNLEAPKISRCFSAQGWPSAALRSGVLARLEWAQPTVDAAERPSLDRVRWDDMDDRRDRPGKIGLLWYIMMLEY